MIFSDKPRVALVLICSTVLAACSVTTPLDINAERLSIESVSLPDNWEETYRGEGGQQDRDVIDSWSQISRRLCIIEDNSEFCIILDIVYKKVVLRVEAVEEDGEIDLIENCEFLNNNNLVIKTRNQKIFIWSVRLP